MTEAVDGLQPFFLGTAASSWFGWGGGEFGGVAEDEVGGGVGVDGVVSADGVEAGAVAAEGEGGYSEVAVFGVGSCWTGAR